MTDDLLYFAQPTPKEVWNTLAAVDVSDHTETNFSGLTYLSWTWAWSIMKRYYPEFTVEWHPTEFVRTPNGNFTASVSCTVRIGPFVEETMWLPVMNPKKGPKGQQNEAELNPTTRDISDTKQRCLVKCFALLGLGLNIYAGEDIPQQPPADTVTSLSREVKQLFKEQHVRAPKSAEDILRVQKVLLSQDENDLFVLKQELVKHGENMG